MGGMMNRMIRKLSQKQALDEGFKVWNIWGQYINPKTGEIVDVVPLQDGCVLNGPLEKKNEATNT